MEADDAETMEGQMAGHMRDKKGQFVKGFNGMKPVGSSSGKKKKLAGQIKDRRVTTRTVDGVNVTTRTRDIGADAKLVKPGTSRSGAVESGTKLKLSKNQKARVDARTADLKAGRDAKLAKAGKAKPAPKPKVQAPARAVKPAPKVQDYGSMTGADKIAAAETMFGTGSKQHEAAKKKFGPKPAKAAAKPAAAKALKPLESDRDRRARLAKSKDPVATAEADFAAAKKEYNRQLNGKDKAATARAKEDWINARAAVENEKLKRDIDKTAKAKAAVIAAADGKKRKVSKAEADLQNERDRLSQELGSIRYDYQQHGDVGWEADAGYVRLDRELAEVDAKLKKMRPAGHPQLGVYRP